MVSANRPWEVYTLTDPRTLRARYVGVTFVGETRRCQSHRNHALKGRTHRDRWIRSLLQLDLRPIYLALEYGTGSGWQEREKFWIAIHRKFCDLTNLTDGGDGTPGYSVSAEHRAKISAATKGHALTAEHRAKISAAKIGRILTAGHRAKISEGKKRYTFTAEHRANMSAAARSRSPEWRAKVSAATKGRPWSAARRKAQKNTAENRKEETNER